MWGYSIIDILHATKRTAAINSDIKENGLKYIAKFEKIAKENRTYIPGEDNDIGKYYKQNKKDSLVSLSKTLHQWNGKGDREAIGASHGVRPSSR